AWPTAPRLRSDGRSGRGAGDRQGPAPPPAAGAHPARGAHGAQALPPPLQVPAEALQPPLQVPAEALQPPLQVPAEALQLGRPRPEGKSTRRASTSRFE